MFLEWRHLSRKGFFESFFCWKCTKRVIVRLEITLMLLCCFSDKTDEDDSASATYQAVSELPQANRDTLAYLVVHLQK